MTTFTEEILTDVCRELEYQLLDNGEWLVVLILTDIY